MNKKIILVFLIAVTCVYCKDSEKDSDKIEIAKHYYNVLDTSNYSGITTWFSDSLITKEGDYEERYSQTEYLEFLKWDAVFEPSYEILEIEEQDGLVKAKISKKDSRILFLHEVPMITNQLITFKKDKIIRVDTYYENFNATTFGKNKNKLLRWIDENHPDLNGFIHDQTEAGGLKYLDAIALYNAKK